MILDEILGAVDQGQVDLEQVMELIATKPHAVNLLLDGPRCEQAVPGPTARCGGPGDRDGEAEAPVRRGAPGAQGIGLLTEVLGGVEELLRQMLRPSLRTLSSS